MLNDNKLLTYYNNDDNNKTHNICNNFNIFHAIFTLAKLAVPNYTHNIQLSTFTRNKDWECSSGFTIYMPVQYSFYLWVCFRENTRRSKSDDYLCNYVSNLTSYIFLIYEARLKCKLSKWKKKRKRIHRKK